jgi:hypothetical protein
MPLPPADPGAPGAAPPPRAAPSRTNTPAEGRGLSRTQSLSRGRARGGPPRREGRWPTLGRRGRARVRLWSARALLSPTRCLVAPSAHAAPARAPTCFAAGAQAEGLLAELETLSALVGPLSVAAFPWMPHPLPDRAAPAVPSADAAAEAGADAGAGEREGARAAAAAAPEPLSLHASVRAELPGRGVVALLAGPP